MGNYHLLHENIDQVVGAYNKFKSDPDAYPDWISWDSDSMLMRKDWDSNSNWKILPVYGSKEIVEDRFGIEWEVMAGMLWKCWSNLWEVVFEYFDFDDVDIVAFSKLKSDQELRPHKHDEYGNNLVFHMAVEIPHGDVGIQSSHGWHQWKRPGEWIVFDPNETHSAWNDT